MPGRIAAAAADLIDGDHGSSKTIKTEFSKRPKVDVRPVLLSKKSRKFNSSQKSLGGK